LQPCCHRLLHLRVLSSTLILFFTVLSSTLISFLICALWSLPLRVMRMACRACLDLLRFGSFPCQIFARVAVCVCVCTSLKTPPTPIKLVRSASPNHAPEGPEQGPLTTELVNTINIILFYFVRLLGLAFRSTGVARTPITRALLKKGVLLGVRGGVGLI
jgi:hypothetical protein